MSPGLRADSIPTEAWITFATSNYFELLEVTIASAHAFSSRPIIAVGVNADIPFSQEKYPRLIKKRINLDNLSFIFYQKPRIMLESGLKYGVYIEADDILNRGCDDLFEYARLEREYPLCPTHPNDPDDVFNIMEILKVNRKSMHYVHGHVIFSHKCMPFIKEWYETCLQYPHAPANHSDEIVLNVLLWKKGITEQVPLYDPWYENVVNYLNATPTVRDASPYSYWKMFHGAKDPRIAWQVFDLIQHHNPRL